MKCIFRTCSLLIMCLLKKNIMTSSCEMSGTVRQRLLLKWAPSVSFLKIFLWIVPSHFGFLSSFLFVFIIRQVVCVAVPYSWHSSNFYFSSHLCFVSSSLPHGNTEACKQHRNSVVIMLDVSVASVSPHRHVFVAMKPPCERTVSFIQI